MERWLSVLAFGEPAEAEARLRRFDGAYRWFLFRAVPLRDEKGAIIRWFGTSTDIEDLKRTESLLSVEKRTLEMIANGATLRDILHNLTPHLHVFALKNADFSRDPQAVERMNHDPLIAKESQPAETAAEMLKAADRLRENMPKFTAPVFIIHGTADKATRPAGSQYFYETATSTDKTLQLYEGHFHDLLNDIGKEDVMADIKAWINKRLPARV